MNTYLYESNHDDDHVLGYTTPLLICDGGRIPYNLPKTAFSVPETRVAFKRHAPLKVSSQ